MNTINLVSRPHQYKVGMECPDLPANIFEDSLSLSRRHGKYQRLSQCDYLQKAAILVYPAWMSLHGVTPIKLHKEGGYRNSLVFYPLKFL